MTRIASSAVRARAELDQPPQVGSSVATSRRTLLSTRTGVTSRIAACQGHDLVGGHRDPPGAASQAIDRGLPATRPPRLARLDDPYTVALHDEVHLSVGQQTRLFSNKLRNRYLALRRDTHSHLLLTGKSKRRCDSPQRRAAIRAPDRCLPRDSLERGPIVRFRSKDSPCSAPSHVGFSVTCQRG